MSDMSDFDKAVVAGMLKAKEIGVKMLASDCEAILQSAIASMQGEAVGYVYYSKGKIRQEYGIKFGLPEAEFYFKRCLCRQENGEPIDGAMIQPVFTYQPSAASKIAEQEARIKELEQQLEEARKVPDGYALVPIEPTGEMIKAMAESKAIDDEGQFPALCELIDFSGENKTRSVLRAAYAAMVSAAIRQIGGGE